MSTFNAAYSKWDNIELSDDESDLHPNIDKDSWFRMKHRSRLEREEKEDKEMEAMNRCTGDDKQRLKIIKARIEAIKSGKLDPDEASVDDIEGLQGEIDEINMNIAKRDKIIESYMKKRSWNIDNICKVKDEKSIVNKMESTSLKADDYAPTGHTEAMWNKDKEATSSTNSNGTSTTSAPAQTASAASGSSTAIKPAAAGASSTSTSNTLKPTPQPVGPIGPVSNVAPEKLSMMSYNDFAYAHEEIMEAFSELGDMERSKQMLFKNCDVLLHEHAQSYMLLSCLEDEMNGKHKRMRNVGRQSQILSHINELGVSMKRDPRDVILPFFARLEDKDHFKGFQNAVDEFCTRIVNRAVEKRKEMDEEREQTELPPREERLGPGGLDPVEVMEMLPTQLQEAFQSRSVDALKDVIANMSPKEAKKWMKMCVDSGLWVPQQGEIFDDEGEEGDDDEDDEVA